MAFLEVERTGAWTFVAGRQSLVADVEAADDVDSGAAGSPVKAAAGSAAVEFVVVAGDVAWVGEKDGGGNWGTEEVR